MSEKDFRNFSECLKNEMPDMYNMNNEKPGDWQHKVSVRKNKNVSDEVNNIRKAIAHNCMNSYTALKYIQYMMDNKLEFSDYERGIIFYTLEYIENEFK